ncbi:MAG: hypothetical protein JWQ71_3800 [Pedosphaera sp.]|nr:hypothetical protein [Pedosphaera sp.]
MAKVKQGVWQQASSTKSHDSKRDESYTIFVKVPTPEQQRQWLGQYRAAAIELEKQRWHELRALTEEQALRISDTLLSIPVANRRRKTSGLVEQQAVFQRARKS